ncbi:MAG TPA: regulatory protein RecX [Bacteroidales bacterium]|nr:regulatory protein RecX [Bacteroidales bacterium]
MAESELFKTSLSKSMSLCSQREYCCSDIREKLHSWGIGNADAEKIISILIKEKFIDEERYSLAFVKDRFKHNKWGKMKISAHLRAKSIPGEIIRSALGSIEDELYRETVKEILISHRKSIKAKNQYDLKGKLLRYGLSKGFESGLLYDLLNDLD